MKLLTQQVSAIDHLKKWKVGALFMDMGTGKTRVACELMNSVPGIDMILWVGPLRTIEPGKGLPSVKDEIRKWGVDKPIYYYGVESIGASDRIYLEVLDLISRSVKPFVVVDESLKIKNSEAKRTKRLLHIGSQVQYKLILNGTPLSRNILDLWSQLEFLSPKILHMTEAEYKNTFCIYTTITKKFPNCYKKITKEYIDGYTNIDYLYSLIRNYVYQCDLKLNIVQNYHDYSYNIDDNAMDIYEDIKERYLDDEMLMMLNNNIFLEMTQKMQHAYCITQDKLDTLDLIFHEIDEKDTIIFCKYVDSREICEKRYPGAKVLSYQKESMGLNLQDYKNTVYFDKIWDYALRTQAGRRTYRTGQEFDCQYYDLTGNVGLEHLINANISKKMDMSEYFKKVTKEELKKVL